MYEFLKARFELARAGASSNVRTMEGLRGFAVSLVFLVHYITLIEPWVRHSAPLFAVCETLRSMGNTGVDLFFVLSGYLIYGSYISREQRFIPFIKRRIVRIYPAFIAVFVLYIAICATFPSENKIPTPLLWDGVIYLAQNFLLLPGLFPVGEPMITVAWSLSYEMFYYLVIPLLIGLFHLRSKRRAWRIGFFMIIATALVAYSAAYTGPVRLVMFISGIVLYELTSGEAAFSPSSSVGFGALIIGLATTLLPMEGSGAYAVKISILFVAFLLLCASCFAPKNRAINRVFSFTPLRWLGNMSYSYYLLHGLSLKAAFLLLPHVLTENNAHPAVIFWGLLPVFFIITLVPTTALFLCVERVYSLKSTQGK